MTTLREAEPHPLTPYSLPDKQRKRHINAARPLIGQRGWNRTPLKQAGMAPPRRDTRPPLTLAPNHNPECAGLTASG